MLVRSVRNDVVKTDGQPPHANACFGDSGGPIIANLRGQNTIAGVSYFTGLYCADYGLYTRIDPFLPFLDEAYRKGGQAELFPRLECVAPNASGTLTAYFGYTNRNGVSITVPYGCKNRLDLDVRGWRPTRFLPGEKHFAFGVDFDENEVVTYTLNPKNSRRTRLHASRWSRRCRPDEAGQLDCAGSCRASLLSGCPGLPTFQVCMDDCLLSADFVRESNPECVPQSVAYEHCVAETPPGVEHWLCYEGYAPSAIGCEAVSYELYACLGYF
jgi:hypothetical protein